MIDSLSDRSNKNTLYVLGFLSLFVLFRTAWIGDDAFITMRTVDNWVNGYGLTWNVDERVQTYTHPLWMFLLSAFYIVIRDGYFTLLIANIAVSFVVFVVFLRRFSHDLFSMLFGWGVLVLSRSFVDYSTSGLENALTHLLLLLFAILFLNPVRLQTARHFLILSLLAGLGATNRMDAILFFLPPLAYLWFTKFRSARGIGILLAGFAPFILWELFSILYYGFPFPNTAYAKLNSGVPQAELFRQGILYFIDLITFDPITFLTIGVSLILVFLHREGREKALAVGSVSYLAYIMYIGGTL
jgi:arabinofuranosyltransferase